MRKTRAIIQLLPEFALKEFKLSIRIGMLQDRKVQLAIVKSVASIMFHYRDYYLFLSASNMKLTASTTLTSPLVQGKLLCMYILQ